jgi:hypothetical protein
VQDTAAAPAHATDAADATESAGVSLSRRPLSVRESRRRMREVIGPLHCHGLVDADSGVLPGLSLEA